MVVAVQRTKGEKKERNEWVGGALHEVHIIIRSSVEGAGLHWHEKEITQKGSCAKSDDQGTRNRGGRRKPTLVTPLWTPR